MTPFVEDAPLSCGTGTAFLHCCPPHRSSSPCYQGDAQPPTPTHRGREPEPEVIEDYHIWLYMHQLAAWYSASQAPP
jgi:hypothetical protein